MADLTQRQLSTAVRENLNNLKYHLEGWREVLIPVHAVLIWQLPYYPLLTWLAITCIFCFFYYLHLSVLTTLAIVGIVVVVSDYSVPILQARWCNPNHWDGIKERKFEDVCYGILCAKENFCTFLQHMTEMKRNQPSMYFVTSMASLLLFAWLGLIMNNLFLTYVLVCAGSMVPGLAHRGYLERYLNIACGNVVTSKAKKQK